MREGPPQGAALLVLSSFKRRHRSAVSGLTTAASQEAEGTKTQQGDGGRLGDADAVAVVVLEHPGVRIGDPLEGRARTRVRVLQAEEHEAVSAGGDLVIVVAGGERAADRLEPADEVRQVDRLADVAHVAEQNGQPTGAVGTGLVVDAGPDRAGLGDAPLTAIARATALVADH